MKLMFENKRRFKESIDLNDYDDCWVECRDGEPLFCYDRLIDACRGIISDRMGDYYQSDRDLAEYTLKRWEGGKLYDVDPKTNEVIYTESKNRMNEYYYDKAREEKVKKLIDDDPRIENLIYDNRLIDLVFYYMNRNYSKEEILAAVDLICSDSSPQRLEWV